MADRKNQLRFAVRAFAPFESALRKTWDAYCQATGCKMELHAVPLELHDLHQTVLTNKGLKTGLWDIAHINTDWIAEAYTTHSIEELTPYIRKNKPEDFPEGWSDSLLGMQSIEQKIYGLPFHDGPECLIYRKDLFESESEKKAYLKQYGKELQAPQTWEDFISIAHFFNRPEANLYGSVFAGFPDGHNTVFDFCLQLWTRGGTLINDQGKIIINSEAAAEGLEFYRKILNDAKAVHPGSMEFDSIKSGMAFARGEVAMMVNWFGFAAMCEVIAESKVKGKVDITDVPRGINGQNTSLNVYYMYVIGAGSPHKDIAFDFIRFAINKENDKLLTLEGGIGCRKSTWKDKEVNMEVPYYSKLEALHEKSNTLPCDPRWAEVAAVIDQVVLQAVNTQKNVKEILAEAQAQVNKILSL